MNPAAIAGSIQETLARARQQLLDARNAAGHWEGYLSSSALSTATAAFALLLFSRATQGETASRCQAASAQGISWLARSQNADGGWGDTSDSPSNISTTTLCWAALGAAGGCEATEQRAAAWLERAAGSLEPQILAQAIVRRYGNDRTFSVPILTFCALAGRLSWKSVLQLPFELAIFPQSWFRFLRLPVVSYALPALIAIGLVRHRNRPTWNPLARLIRSASAGRALRVLRTIQPAGGGFLEATPLTSFVLMSLVSAGEAGGPVARDAVDFLLRSMRADGSWPIDTNLSTWVTTLSVNALSMGEGLALSTGEQEAIRSWLLNQQYRVRHPYTGAPPGAWAWTDLPGGAPDADDTAGALLALRRLARVDPQAQAAAVAGIGWLLDVQNRDGGIPTFCRGWGKLPFDRSAPDLTAHALSAWSAWRDAVAESLGQRMDLARQRAMAYLARTQRADGAWVPLWFGNQSASGEENPTYGTSRVLAALRGLGDAQEMADRAAQWLMAAQNDDGGWGGDRGVPSSIEETGWAVQALAVENSPAQRQAALRGAAWIAHQTRSATVFNPSPLGLYFAKLWYSERLYPLIATVAALAAVQAAQQD